MTEPSLLCVHAHPDDEALWTGGTLARFADAGARTGVVTCTWTEGTRRVAELARSLDILGAGEPRLLGYADGNAGLSAPGAARFVDAPLDEAVGRLVGHIREAVGGAQVGGGAGARVGDRARLHDGAAGRGSRGDT
ncbi:PIG-L deacetylase family protein [Nonomuraea aurantiaca]|uniref:PIG-L deacetylase family protein n=1 Tax=Nonomuraea aurantiaca TaxID=2878562 RepID=UPI001CD9DA9D|nr:PIG-L family deacetylase [Nonomuraea aurantiaca]MCA2222037.1 PIG-L family deacetylase [Nonomuraea aurantiaca]